MSQSEIDFMVRNCRATALRLVVRPQGATRPGWRRDRKASRGNPHTKESRAMNPLNRMNPGTYQAKVTNASEYPIVEIETEDGEPILINYGGPKRVTTDEAARLATKNYPYTGNGYSVAINPLLEEPATVDEYVSLIRARGASLEWWTYKNAKLAADAPIIREIIARMEGDLQGLRTLVKDMEAAGE